MPTLRSGLHTEKAPNNARKRGRRASVPSKKCTYDLGYIRQPVYLCVTCTPPAEAGGDEDGPRGVCTPCSKVCHNKHRLVALLHKRNFRCDCCTTGMEHPCSLEKETYQPNNVITRFGTDPENIGNKYDQNFRRRFCRCERTHDLSRDTMAQCLNCEDWFHESCLNADSSETDSPGVTGPEISPSKALLPKSAYDTFICGSCVLDNPTLRLYAGTRNVKMIVRQPGSAWLVLDGDDVVEGKDTTRQRTSNKRIHLDNEVDERETKKVRMEQVEHGSPDGSSDSLNSAIPARECNAPVPNPIAAKVLTSLASTQFKSVAIDAKEKRDDAVQQALAEGAEETEMYLLPQENKGIADGAVPNLGEVEKAGVGEAKSWDGQGDIFLTKGWRERWCQCLSCLPPLEGQPYLLREEETYG